MLIIGDRNVPQIGLGSGLVLSDNEPLPVPILAPIYVAVWRHLATVSQNIELQ